MKKIHFTDEEQFLEWNEQQGNFVTPIFDGGEFLCHVLEKDVLYLQSIGFLDGCSIVPELDFEQQQMFKDSWGVEVVIINDCQELYDEICRVLTWYENPGDYPFGEDLAKMHIAEEMYKVLVNVQNKLFNK